MSTNTINDLTLCILNTETQHNAAMKTCRINPSDPLREKRLHDLVSLAAMDYCEQFHNDLRKWKTVFPQHDRNVIVDKLKDHFENEYKEKGYDYFVIRFQGDLVTDERYPLTSKDNDDFPRVYYMLQTAIDAANKIRGYHHSYKEQVLIYGVDRCGNRDDLVWG